TDRLEQPGDRAGNCLLARKRAAVDDRGLRFRWPPVGGKRFEQPQQLLRSGVTDDRSLQPCEAGPVDIRWRAALVLVPADQRDGVAASGIRDGDAGISGDCEAGSQARHHLERNAVLVKEQCLLAATIEDERIAPLQPGDKFSFARFLEQQIADGVLRRGRLRGSRADVDELGALPRILQQPRGNKMFVDDDIGAAKMVKPSNRYQTRITRPRPDQINSRALHGWMPSTAACARSTSRRIAAAPRESRSCATAVPAPVASLAAPRDSARMARAPSRESTMAVN